MKVVNIHEWIRKEYYEFYSTFDEPFYGITTNIDCTKAYTYCKKNNLTFFSYYLHKAVSSLNEIPEFRYRILNDQVVLYDKINASPTIGRENGTFGFSFVELDSDFNQFNLSLQSEISRVKSSEGIGLSEKTNRIDVIHCSSIPWISFTSLSHARNFKINDSVPKISFGKFSITNEVKQMPVSLHAHHAFVDGRHMGHFFDLFQEKLNMF